MKGFLTVLKFELMHYFKNKVFLIATFALVALVSIGLSVPTIIDAFDDETEVSESTSDDLPTYGFYDPEGYVDDLDFLNGNFHIGDMEVMDDLQAMKDQIKAGEMAGGFVMKSPTNYEYVLLNNEMSDRGVSAFEYAYTITYQRQGFEAQGVEYDKIVTLINPRFQTEIDILGKDSASNYGYTYILVFGLYMVIIMYGQLIATAVASEKSNRTMELLVTSTKSTYLIFGKVISGALAGILQFGLIISAAMVSYNLNSKAWDGDLDFLFDIPGDVLLNFSLFGILGYLFFAFTFGALGALVSKTEDVSASATPVTMIFVVVFLIAMMGMNDTSSVILKVASFIPVSSFLAMFVRVSMGAVTTLEVVISLVILAVTTFGVGIIAARIYRMGTLMYGNPVKIKDIPKIMKSQ